MKKRQLRLENCRNEERKEVEKGRGKGEMGIYMYPWAGI
jgi:hypothetical protein